MTKNWMFGALAPTTNHDAVVEQIRRSHKYRNTLVALELERRAASESTIRRLSPEYATLAAVYDATHAEVEDAFSELKLLRAKTRTRCEPTPEIAERIAAAKAARSEAAAAMKSAKSAAYQLLAEKQAELKVKADASVPQEGSPTTRKKLVTAEFLGLAEAAGIDAGAAAYERNFKACRKLSGCYWGTYLPIEDACKDFGKGAPPRFERWDECGAIAVQLQGGLSVADAIACNDTQLRIVQSPELQERLATKGKARFSAAHGVMQIRYNSDEKSKPLWAEVPVVWHRPLPPNGKIKWAFLHRNKVGDQFRWSVRIVVEEPDVATADHANPGSIAAIHPGWRLLPNGDMRVAVIVGSDGQTREVTLPAARLRDDAKVAELQSVRDILFNAFLPTFADWIDAHRAELPEWFNTETETIRQWQSAERLRKLLRKWRDDESSKPHWDIPKYADSLQRHLWHHERTATKPASWLHQELHLLEWQENLRLQLQDQRKNDYRHLAKELAKQYEFVAISDVDWSELAKREGPLEDVAQTNTHRRMARLASPGIMLQFVRERFAGRIVNVPAKHITAQCHICGQVDEFDRRELTHECSNCKTEWDQDVNGARNQLARATELRSKTDDVADTKMATARKPRRNRKSA